MTRQLLLTFGVAVGFFFLLVDHARAEIPAKSKKELELSASHILHGTVHQTYERKEKDGDYEYTYGVAEVAVQRVDKGADVIAKDRVFVRYWRKNWIGNGTPPPDHSGHWDIPVKLDLVEIYVNGDRNTGFDVLSPNGFFKVTKPASSKKNPSP